MKHRSYSLEDFAPNLDDLKGVNKKVMAFESQERSEKKQRDDWCKRAKEGEPLATTKLKNRYSCKVYTQTEIKNCKHKECFQ